MLVSPIMPEYRKENINDLQALVEEATFDYTMGDNDEALRKLNMVVGQDPGLFEAWHAMTEIYFSEKRYDDALAAAEKAHAIRSDDVHINTSLSRIWMEKGDKKTAEHFGTQARILGWKDQLKEQAEEP